MHRGKGATPRQQNGAPRQDGNVFKSADPLVERLIAGRYRIKKLLGRGGIGNVYLADDTQSERNRQVAVKLLQERYSRDERMIKRFQREARAGLGIHHHNVVPCTDVSFDSTIGRVFIVMEYVPGEELTVKLGENRRFSWDETRHVALQLCDALKAAHDNELIHRDIKPDNIIIREHDKRLMLLDFGLAKFTEEIDKTQVTEVGIVLGTPTYMAPEQIWGGGDYDHRVDIYAVGTIMFRMLAGRAPFIGKPDAIMVAKRDETPKKMTEVVPGLNIPADIEEVLMRAIEKDPERRYPDIETFKRAILQRDPFPTEKSAESIAQDLMGQLMRSIAAEQNLEIPSSMQDDIQYVPEPVRKPGAFRRFLKRFTVISLIGAAVAGYVYRDQLKDTVSEYYYRARDYVSSSMDVPTPQRSTNYIIETRPRGADIYELTGHGERLLGDTGSGVLRKSLEGGQHTLIIRKRGYMERRIVISPERTQISVGLRRIPRARKRQTIRLESAQPVTSEPSEDEAVDGTESTTHE